MLEAGTLLGVLAVGVLAGLVSGLFGVGGGALMVPAALYLVPGTGFHDAKAASLLVIIGSAGAGAWTHYRRRSVDVRAGALLALGGLAGAPASILLVERLDETILAVAFGLLLVLVGARLASPKAPTPRQASPRLRDVSHLALGGLGGLLAGAFGIGGGIALVPGLVLSGLGMHLAVGTSLLAILGSAIAGTFAHLAIGYGPTLLALGLPLSAGAIPGTILGARLAHEIHADRLRRAFGSGLVLLGGAMALDSWI